MSDWFAQLLERLGKLLTSGKIQEKDPFPERIEDVVDDEEG